MRDRCSGRRYTLACGQPDRDVRGFQSVLLDLGARLGLPAMTNEDGSAKFADYADYMINHQRKPGIGPLAGFRGEKGDQSGRGEPNPDQIDRYIENGGFWMEEIPKRRNFTNMPILLIRTGRSRRVL